MKNGGSWIIVKIKKKIPHLLIFPFNNFTMKSSFTVNNSML